VVTPHQTSAGRASRRRAAPAVAALLLPLLAGCGSGSSTTAQDQNPQAPTRTTSGSPSNVTCDYADAPQGATGHATKPPSTPDVQGTLSLSIHSSIGVLNGQLDADKAPCTVNSFASLAKQGFFAKTPCHRLTTAPSPIFVLQCGDPTGTGTGGPGYTVPDEFSDTDTYGPGTLAMANTQQPNSGGSQFFIVYRNSPLPPKYTVFGHVDPAAVEAIRKTAEKGTDNAYGQGDGHPTVSVTIDSVTVG
jgi:peptidyl-prolyl cis-trans isomerase B (cyclophilin B)